MYSDQNPDSLYSRMYSTQVSAPGGVPMYSSLASAPGGVPMFSSQASAPGGVPMYSSQASAPGGVPMYSSQASAPGGVPNDVGAAPLHSVVTEDNLAAQSLPPPPDVRYDGDFFREAVISLVLISFLFACLIRLKPGF